MLGRHQAGWFDVSLRQKKKKKFAIFKLLNPVEKGRALFLFLYTALKPSEGMQQAV